MKTRHFLTVAEKIEILDFHEKNKEISVRNLSAIFSQKYEKIFTKSVIDRIKHQKLQLRQVPVKFRKRKNVTSQEEQNFLNDVYAKFLEKGLRTSVTRDMILTIAGNVAKLPEHCAQFGSKTPFSEDWFKSFVKIFGLRYKKVNGAKKYIPKRDLDFARAEAMDSMKNFEEEHTFNADTSAFQLNFNGAMSWQPIAPEEDQIINKVILTFLLTKPDLLTISIY